MKLSNPYLVVESTNTSMRGRGKLSFGQALLRSVKSTHILHFPLDFFTKTLLLADHLDELCF
jgi:phosphoglycerate dehydrogenase-like enzyme